ADRNRSHWSTSKTPSYTKSVSWQHHRKGIPPALLNRLTNSDVQVINTFLTRVSKLELSQQEKDWIIKIISMV
ncbi:hypothetical protein, partial [Escherichia coli]|uniref:hypothetical protein n=1 Tax=Escherichia coli TaxID=562 RepID=UPI000B7EE20B